MKKQFLKILVVMAMFFVAIALSPNSSRDIKGGALALLGKDILPNENPIYTLMRLPRGGITFLGSPKDMEKYGQSLAGLATLLSSKGIPFLVVQAPHKIPYDVAVLPNGYPNYPGQNSQRLVDFLVARKVSVLDLRNSIKESSYFYKTDHHWTTEAGFVAAGLLSQHLNRNYGFNISSELYNADLYYTSTIRGGFLGSVGWDIGRYFAGLDDFTLYSPRFKTQLTLEIPSGNTVKQGSFTECYSNPFVLPKQYGYSKNIYTYYTSDHPLEISRNPLAKNGKRVLILRDSFGCVLTPFLSLGVSELHVIDTRYYKESISEYAAQNKVDLVIFHTATGYSDQQFSFKP